MLVYLKKYITAILATTGTGLISYLIYRYFSNLRNNKFSTKKRIKYKCPTYEIRRSLTSLDSADWEDVGTVKDLWIYPLKSCRGISYKEVTTDKFGPKYHCCKDRSLLIIDENGDMITARKVSSTVLITPQYDRNDNIITLEFPHLQPMQIYLPLVEIESVFLEGKVWGEEVRGLDCGVEVADWLTLALGRPCRLMYHGNLASERSTSDKCSMKHPLMKSDDNSLYGDFSGYMLMSEESLVDLQSRAKCEMYVQNFRPNILVKGCQAYDEDVWTYIKIGDAIFRNISPCERCLFPTINFMTGKRNARSEPIKTLRSYRCPDKGQDPLLGINLGIDRVAQIKVGDTVWVLRN